MLIYKMLRRLLPLAFQRDKICVLIMNQEEKDNGIYS